MLTPERIAQLASGPKVKARAVENFLGTLHGKDYQEHIMNAEMDAKSYRWNHETVAAIKIGVLEHCKK